MCTTDSFGYLRAKSKLTQVFKCRVVLCRSPAFVVTRSAEYLFASGLVLGETRAAKALQVVLKLGGLPNRHFA
jgi:hypothetical protein